MSATHVDLPVTGMTCAACANRIERKLNKLDGVTATVNYATEKASVDFDPGVVGASELITTIESIGYGATLPESTVATIDEAPDPHLESLRRRLRVSLMLGVPVLLLSMVEAFQFRNWQWLAFALAAPVATWGAWPFHRVAFKNLRTGGATMDTLVSLGVIAAFAWSTWALFFTAAGDNGIKMSMTFGRPSHEHGAPHLYLEVASTIVALILAGRFFEARSKRRAGDALRALVNLGAKDVGVLGADNVERRVPIAMLSVGDQFVVRPSEKIATDGVVEDGMSAVDASLVTGESVPVDVQPGSVVIGATINTSGRLIVRATRVGADTQLAQMARLVEAAQSGKAQVQRLADRVSAVFVPVVLVLALATFVGWLIREGDVASAFRPAVAVLIIACPCALGLATPTALMVGTGRGAQLGILIRGPEVLESTRRIDTVVLDKTGTVTTGTMTVASIRPSEGTDAAAVVRLAAAVESASEHPIGRAIVHAASPPLPPVSDFIAHAGTGVEGTVEGRRVVVKRAARSTGGTTVEVSCDDELLGEIDIADTVKPSSGSAVASLRALGLTPILLSGDSIASAESVAAQVGITDVRAEVLPADKVSVIVELQRQGRVVAMVGDGANDAAALAQADLGIAMGTGTDAAIEASDLTLVRSDLLAAADAIRLARRTLAVIKGNLFWAFAYNVAAIPLAMAGWLSPAIAGAAMAFSSVFVVSNSLRLRRFS